MSKIYNKIDLLHIFCKTYFGDKYSIGNTSLSDTNTIYEVIADDLEYIIKFVSFYNPISLIRLNSDFIRLLINLASKVNKKGIGVCTVEIDQVWETNVGTIFLMKKDKLSLFEVNDVCDINKAAKALKEFHLLTKRISTAGLITLPWFHLSPELIKALCDCGRWKDVEPFFKKYRNIFHLNKLSVNHNDLHPGNLFQKKDKLIFLDLNELCLASEKNDLGIVVANYLHKFFVSRERFEAMLIELLKSYYATSPSSDDLKESVIYALRKLYLIEAYYSYLSKTKNIQPGLIASFRKQQDFLVSYL